MAISVGGTKGSMSEPNVVPLIDVLLVLIIIFMAITPTTPTGMGTLVPQPPKKKEQQQQLVNKTVVVQISATGQVKINQTDTTWAALGPQLADIFKIRADKTAFVRGDDDAPFADVARAIDIMKGAGITNVGLITQKMEEGQ